MIIDDDAAMCDMLKTTLEKKDFSPVIFTSTGQAFNVLMEEEFDVVITDLNMKGLNGLQLCNRVAANRPDIPVIIITAFGSMETVISAIRAGAYDFINKPFDIDVLILMLDRAVEHHNLKEKIKNLSAPSNKPAAFENIIGKSEIMKNLFNKVAIPEDIACIRKMKK